MKELSSQEKKLRKPLAPDILIGSLEDTVHIQPDRPRRKMNPLSLAHRIAKLTEKIQHSIADVQERLDEKKHLLNLNEKIAYYKALSKEETSTQENILAIQQKGQKMKLEELREMVESTPIEETLKNAASFTDMVEGLRKWHYNTETKRHHHKRKIQGRIYEGILVPADQVRVGHPSDKFHAKIMNEKKKVKGSKAPMSLKEGMEFVGRSLDYLEHGKER